MIFRKCRHYCSPFPFPKFYKVGDNFHESISVRFNESIRYDLGEDQSDVNKLFGYSYGWHHDQSDRIGFRYVPATRNVEIVLYSYSEGKRLKTEHLCNFEIGVTYQIDFGITIVDNLRSVQVVIFDQTHKVCEASLKRTYKVSKYGYTLGGYFGGNRRAPHKITIEYNEI
jgi:hypothetical protein